MVVVVFGSPLSHRSKKKTHHLSENSPALVLSKNSGFSLAKIGQALAKNGQKICSECKQLANNWLNLAGTGVKARRTYIQHRLLTKMLT